MSTATANRSARRSTVVQPTDVSADLRLIAGELNDQYFERSSLIEAFILCILAKAHGFVIGPPGTGKSDLTNELCSRFVGATYFKTQFHTQFSVDDLFGPTDMALYDQTSKNGKGIWERDIEGTLADCHIANLDEIDKSGKSANLMLSVMNEREYKNGKTTVQTPLISAFGSANFFMDDDLGAIFDRFLVRIEADYIEESSNFIRLMDLGVVKGGPAPTRTTIDLADLQHAINVLVPAITLPPGVATDLATLRIKLREAGIRPSDRRWRQSGRLLQASAFLSGRTIVDNDDLIVLENVLWERPDQIIKVREEVRAVTSELAIKAAVIEKSLAEIGAEVRAMVNESGNDRSKVGINAKIKVEQMDTELRDLIEAAHREGRSTTRYDNVRGQIKAVKSSIFTICLGMTADQAAKKIGSA